jgi:glycosyltransferase involved in cell wall biosynthesis
MPTKRLALLHNNLPVTPLAVHFAKGLVKAGVEVDFFFDNTFPPVADIHRHSHIPGLRFITIMPDRADHAMRRRNREDCLEYRNTVIAGFGPENSAGYAGIIGVEKIGCILAAALGEKWRIAHFCWSLELYDEHHNWHKSIPCADFWLEMEALALKSAEGIIIQDEDRAAALDARLQFSGRYIRLPVTIDRENVQARGGHSLHNIYDIEHDRKILLCYGHNRMSQDWLIALTENLPEPWTLVLHGLNMHGLSNMPQSRKLKFSSKRLPERQIPALIASASAGLAHYTPDHPNNILTAFSSEKLARYLAAGLPVIACGIGNISKLFEQYPCGLSYSEPNQIKAVLQTLEKNAELFQRMAGKAAKLYLFEWAGREALRFFSEIPAPAEAV